ncbi:MAG: Uma2 family endonuclease [Sporichthyaceae bacterium]
MPFATYLALHGPWSVEQYHDRPDELMWCELLDGELLVNPSPTIGHQRIANRLMGALHSMQPDGFEVTTDFGVQVSPLTVLMPDVSVLSGYLSEDVREAPSSIVPVVIEVASTSTVASDRAIKPRLYAEAGIPIYVRIERDGPRAIVGRLVGDRYVWSEPDGVLRLDYPFPVEIDLSALVAPPA